MSKLLKNITKFIEPLKNFLNKNNLWVWCLLIVFSAILLCMRLSNYSNDRNKVVDTMNSMDNLDKNELSTRYFERLEYGNN